MIPGMWNPENLTKIRKRADINRIQVDFSVFSPKTVKECSYIYRRAERRNDQISVGPTKSLQNLATEKSLKSLSRYQMDQKVSQNNSSIYLRRPSRKLNKSELVGLTDDLDLKPKASYQRLAPTQSKGNSKFANLTDQNYYRSQKYSNFQARNSISREQSFSSSKIKPQLSFDSEERLRNKLSPTSQMTKGELKELIEENCKKAEEIEISHLQRGIIEEDQKELELKREMKGKKDVLKWMKVPSTTADNSLLNKMVRIRLLEILSDVGQVNRSKKRCIRSKNIWLILKQRLEV